jgi:hypothetical protein
MHNKRRRGRQPGQHDQIPATHNKWRRGQRPGRNNQVIAIHNERRRGQRPGYNDQVPATHNERRRGQRPGAKIKNLRRTASGASGNGMDTKIKRTTIKYPRRTTDAAGGSGLGTTPNYLRGAAGNGRAQRPSTFDAQRAPRVTV